MSFVQMLGWLFASAPRYSHGWEDEEKHFTLNLFPKQRRQNISERWEIENSKVEKLAIFLIEITIEADN